MLYGIQRTVFKNYCCSTHSMIDDSLNSSSDYASNFDMPIITRALQAVLQLANQSFKLVCSLAEA
jgi:hypothetical protein